MTNTIDEETKPRIKIAVIDDDVDTGHWMEAMLKRENFHVEIYRSPTDFVAKFEYALNKDKEKKMFLPDLILCDIMMPEMDGLTLLARLKGSLDQIPLIFVTAHGSMETAIQAMRQGAFDFILKPINISELKVAIDRALNFQQLKNENTVLRQQIKATWAIEGIVGKSPKIRQVFDVIARISKTDANVLINGESGTGKELVARAIHKTSQRGNGNFVAINCSAIPESLLESELFGHAKGSFTGAINKKKGLFEVANGGTLFLDEIGDMNFTLQAKLLRVIQERKIRPVGDNADHDIDVRILSATHKNLKLAIKNGEFREDLFYRLNVIPIEIPSLRERAEDIPLLAEHFLKKYTAAHNMKVRGFTKSALTKLMEQPWPGNIRELENTVERAVILCEGDEIDPSLIRNTEGHEVGAGAPVAAAVKPLEEDFNQNLTLEEVEKRYIQFILNKTNGAKETAARILGIDRKTLYRKERDYGLQTAAEAAERPSSNN